MHTSVLLLLIALFPLAGRAQTDYPSQTVKIVVPYPISGPTDIRGSSRMTKTYKLMSQHAPPAISDTLARTVVQAIRAATPHKVVLERQPGVATARGAASVAKAPADGHTLLLASNATIVINPQYFHGVEYEPARDFVLVAPLVTMPFVLLVNSGVPVDTPRTLAAWLKPRPGEINYASSGEGSTAHLAGELFRRATGVEVVHVSYNGGLAALNGLATGQVSVMFAALPLALPYLASEHLKVLGIASARRYMLLPELPTLAESGVPEFDVEAWYGVFAPARTPPAAAVWLGEQISAAVSNPATRFQLYALGLEPVTSPRGKFATRINTEIEKWASLLRASRMPLKDGAQ